MKTNKVTWVDIAVYTLLCLAIGAGLAWAF